MNIAGFNTRRVMIDNGSSADILYLPAYQQMKLDKEKLLPMEAPLVGFTGDKTYPVGIVTLPITIDTYPKQVSKKLTSSSSIAPQLTTPSSETDTQPITSSDLYLPPPYQVPNRTRNRRCQRRSNSSQRMLPRFIGDKREESNDDNRRVKNSGRAIRRTKHIHPRRRTSRKINQDWH